jgi:hypothetical protein
MVAWLASLMLALATRLGGVMSSSSSRLLRGIGRRPLACGVTVLLGAAALPGFVRADGAAPPIKIAVFNFELEDDSPSAVLLNKSSNRTAIMEKVTSEARRELTQSGRYSIVDVSESQAKPVLDKSLRNCEGCEAQLALQLGAQQSLIGVVRPVTQTDYYVVVRIRDARTGKIVDQEEANFAGDETGWPTGVRMLIKHQVLPNQT